MAVSSLLKCLAIAFVANTIDAQTLCSFSLTVDNTDIPSLAQSQIDLNEAQLAGTQSANLALALIPGNLDIAATIEDCDGGEYTANTQFDYSADGGSQQVTLVAIKTSVDGVPLVFDADFRPVIASIVLPFKIGHEVTSIDINAVDYGTNAGIQSASVTATCDGEEIVSTSGGSTTLSLDFSSTSFPDGQQYPVSCDVQAQVTDVSSQASNTLSQSLLVDPQAELRIGAVVANPPSVSTANLVDATISVNQDNVFTLTVDDYDLGRSGRSDEISGWSESISCTFTVSTTNRFCETGDCQQFNCEDITVSQESTVVGDSDFFTVQLTAPSGVDTSTNYGATLCKLAATCEDNTAQLGSVLGQTLSNQVANSVEAAFLVEGVATKQYDQAVLRNLYMINSVYDAAKPIELYYTSTTYSGDGAADTTLTGTAFIDASGCTFQEGDFITGSIPSCAVQYSTTDMTTHQQFDLTSDASFTTPGVHFIWLASLYTGGVRYYKLPVSYTVDGGRRLARRQDNAPAPDTTSFTLTVANDSLVVDVANARTFDDIIVNVGNQDQDAGSPTPPPTPLADSEDKRVEVWVLAVIATGSLLLVIVGIVAVVLMKRTKARQTAKVMPFWEQASPQYHPGQTKTINGNAVDSSSF